MILSDRKIADYASKGMINPHSDSLIRQVDNRRLVSYGQSSYGYDIRLSPTDFRIFTGGEKLVIDPKNFDDRAVKAIPLSEDDTGKFFVLPPYTYALGVSMEEFNMPPDITGACQGKSTYARLGLIVNITPLEAGWIGYLTLEFFNATPYELKLYAEEGIAQIIFLQGEPCRTSYADRAGKYQCQSQKVVLAKV